MKENKNKDQLSEPEAVYHKKTIEQFASFEARDAERSNYFTSLSPEQLLKNLKQMTLAAFGIKDEAELKNSSRKINLKPRP